MQNGQEREPVEVPIWDAFVRAFHWLLTLAFAGAWLLGEFGPGIMTWHFYFGYAVLGLIALRLVWGFVGPKSARFRSYFYAPKVVVGYLRRVLKRSPSYWSGHNPVGGLYILLLLVVVGAIAVTGLFADPEDCLNIGPLAKHVSIETSRKAIVWHGRLANLALAMVVFHIAAIAFYKIWKHEDLVRPMFTGRKLVRPEDPSKPGAKGVLLEE